MIQHLKHNEIDKRKWDACITNSSNSRVYALSWYLDIVSPNWDAFIIGDYQLVMPITWIKKYGIKLTIQPSYCQQLGVFGDNISQDIVKQFMDELSQRYKYINIKLNSSNSIADSTKLKVQQNTNCELYLNNSYSDICNLFSTNCKRNLKKAQQEKFTITLQTANPSIIAFKKKHAQYPLSNNVYKKLESLMKEADNKHVSQTMVYKDEHNEILSVVFFISTLKRIVYLSSVSSEKGKEKRAAYAIIDFMIKKYAHQNIIFDFEGSNNIDIARFFTGFGAAKTEYNQIKVNQFCFPLHIILNKI